MNLKKQLMRMQLHTRLLETLKVNSLFLVINLKFARGGTDEKTKVIETLTIVNKDLKKERSKWRCIQIVKDEIY